MTHKPVRQQKTSQPENAAEYAQHNLHAVIMSLMQDAISMLNEKDSRKLLVEAKSAADEVIKLGFKHHISLSQAKDYASDKELIDLLAGCVKSFPQYFDEDTKAAISAIASENLRRRTTFTTRK